MRTSTPEASGCPPGIAKYKAFSDFGHAGIRFAMIDRLSSCCEIGSQYSSNVIRALAECSNRDISVRAVRKKVGLVAVIRMDVTCDTSFRTGEGIGRRQVSASTAGR